MHPFLSAVVAVALLATGETVTEPRTGVRFESTYDAGGTALAATGTSYRSKWGFQVYALAHYGDPAAEASGSSEEQLGFWQKTDKAKAIVLKFVRDVEKDKITDALNEAFDEAGYKSATRAEFAKAFTKDFAEGDTLAFVSTGGGAVKAVQNGTELGAWNDAALVSALWSTWLGENSVLNDRTKLVGNGG